MNCIKCSGTTKKIKSTRVFHDKIIIHPVCNKCGKEYVGEKEYARLLKKVQKLESEIDSPPLKSIQFLVA